MREIKQSISNDPVLGREAKCIYRELLPESPSPWGISGVCQMGYVYLNLAQAALSGFSVQSRKVQLPSSTPSSLRVSGQARIPTPKPEERWPQLQPDPGYPSLWLTMPLTPECHSASDPSKSREVQCLSGGQRRHSQEFPSA
jgi:hypothetical protein